MQQEWISMAKMENHSSPLPCFQISAPILFFPREKAQLYTLKFIQDILPTEKKNQGGFEKMYFEYFF